MKNFLITHRVLWICLLLGLGLAVARRVYFAPSSAPQSRQNLAPPSKHVNRITRLPGYQRQQTARLLETHVSEPDQAEPLRDSELETIRDWAGTEPRAAADWVSRLPAGPARHDAIKGVAIVWANSDLPSAIQWVRQLPDGEERHSAILSVAYEAARTDPMEALTLAREIPANQSQVDLITHAAAEWAATAPAAAAEWATQIPDVALRESVLVSVATAWGDSDPVAAANLAVNTITEEKQQDDAIVGIVQRWGQQDADAATAWVTPFPEGILRETALENLANLRLNLAAPGR